MNIKWYELSGMNTTEYYTAVKVNKPQLLIHGLVGWLFCSAASFSTRPFMNNPLRLPSTFTLELWILLILFYVSLSGFTFERMMLFTYLLYLLFIACLLTVEHKLYKSRNPYLVCVVYTKHTTEELAYSLHSINIY